MLRILSICADLGARCESLGEIIIFPNHQIFHKPGSLEGKITDIVSRSIIRKSSFYSSHVRLLQEKREKNMEVGRAFLVLNEETKDIEHKRLNYSSYFKVTKSCFTDFNKVCPKTKYTNMLN